MGAENCGCSYAEEVVYPEVTVYQSAEQIPSFPNNAHKAESKFDKLSDKIAKQYEKKGMSPKEAKEIGAKTAYTIGRKKYGKAGMARKARAGMRAESFGEEGKNQVYIVENIHPTQSFILGVFSDYSHGKKLMDKIFIEELKHSNEEVFDINTHKPTKNEIKQAKKEFEWYSSDRNISFISPSEPDRYYTLTPVKVLDDLTHSEGYDKELFDSGILDFDQYSFKENYPFKDAESFEAQGNPDKRTTTQYATFYVGWEDEEGELRGGGKFKKYDDALAQAKIVSDRNGNSRIVSTRGFALWTDDGKGMWQEGYDKAEAKKFYSAEEDISIAQGWRLGLGMGLGLMTLSALTTLVAFGLTKRDEGQE